MYTCPSRLSVKVFGGGLAGAGGAGGLVLLHPINKDTKKSEVNNNAFVFGFLVIGSKSLHSLNLVKIKFILSLNCSLFQVKIYKSK